VDFLLQEEQTCRYHCRTSRHGWSS